MMHAFMKLMQASFFILKHLAWSCKHLIYWILWAYYWILQHHSTNLQYHTWFCKHLSSIFQRTCNILLNLAIILLKLIIWILDIHTKLCKIMETIILQLIQNLSKIHLTLYQYIILLNLILSYFKSQVQNKYLILWSYSSTMARSRAAVRNIVGLGIC